MSKSRGLVAAALVVFCLFVGLSGPETIAAQDMGAGMPGIYEVASNGAARISVTDMHRYDVLDRAGMSWKLTIGLVIQNNHSEDLYIDPASFQVLDSIGEAHWPLSKDLLKNPLKPSWVRDGQVILGSLAFQMDEMAEPQLLVWNDQGLEIRLNKEIKPPGDVHPPGKPVPAGKSIVGIEGISASSDGKTYRIDYILKNNAGYPISLQERAYGKFAMLTDEHGISYTAQDYKMLGPAIPPGDSVEGYLCYYMPDDVEPRYLLFWPPDDDAVVFDLSGR